MGNTKRLYYTLFAGITPDFNEVEFQNLLKGINIEDIEQLWKLIDIKGRIFNKLISREIESYIDKLRNYWHISIGTLEHKIFNNKSLGKKLCTKGKLKQNLIEKVSKKSMTLLKQVEV